MSVDLILRQARPGGGEPADIAVDAGRIVSIEPRLATSGRQEIDLAGRVVLPGFVDVHQHLDKAYTFDEVGGADGNVDARERMQRYKARLTAENVYARGEQVLRRLLRHGTCALRSHVDVDSAAGVRGVAGVLALRQDWADRLRIQAVAFARGLTDLSDPDEVALLRRALDMGCEVVGGAPSLNAQPRFYVDVLLGLAKEYGCLVDLHVDESGVPDASVLEYVAEATLREGLEGRVTCSHCCTLAVVPDEVADRVIEKLKQARIVVCANPLTNLYLQGGGGRVPGFRGLTRIRDLWAAGVPVCCGSDNVRDAFNAFGNGDPLLAALIAGLACRMGSAQDHLALLDTITTAGAAALGLTDYGLREGARADLVAFECDRLDLLVAEQPARRLVLLSGRPVSGTASSDVQAEASGDGPGDPVRLP